MFDVNKEFDNHV